VRNIATSSMSCATSAARGANRTSCDIYSRLAARTVRYFFKHIRRKPNKNRRPIKIVVDVNRGEKNSDVNIVSPRFLLFECCQSKRGKT
jgi:hypothetical protein